MTVARRRATRSTSRTAGLGRAARAGIAHEINNPLTGVLTYSSFLLKRATDEETKSDLETIVHETKRCRDIVRGLLDFARQTPPKRLPTDLNEVVRDARTIVTNQLALAHGRDWAGSRTGPVPADANQIQQVMVNLLLMRPTRWRAASPGVSIRVPPQ
jgi:two-component system NtrC family sensor kinase